MITDPIFETIYNEKILKKLKKRFGKFEKIHVDFRVSDVGMSNFMAILTKKGRRGEVIMVVPNENGEIWLHTKSFYPDGTYRLMSGGLEMDENPHKALKREVREETGFKTKIDRCLAVITYTLTSEQQQLPFVSYVFRTP
ncbi:MAG: NUDIX hydrolase, partial [Chloroflexota bacterium]